VWPVLTELSRNWKRLMVDVFFPSAYFVLFAVIILRQM